MYGDTVRRARESRGLSQSVLAEISGISQSNISAIERDRRHPSTETFHRLLTACGYELVAMAGAKSLGIPPPPDPDLPFDLFRDGDNAISGSQPPDRPDNDAGRYRQLEAALLAAEATLRARQ